MDQDKLKDLLDEIGIKDNGKMEKDRYIVKLKNSDEFSKYYTLLDSCDYLDLSDSSSMSGEFATVLSYYVSDFRVSLNANFIDDYYTFVVEEDKDE